MKDVKRLIAVLIATGLGSGFSPKAPGTAGTLVAVGLSFLLRDWNWESMLILWILLFAAGWWASWFWSREKKMKDSPSIVIDEVLGYLLSVFTLPKTLPVLLIQFIFFRILDVLKPPPIRQLDRWGKQFEIGPLQSLGVILDDLLAGALCLILFLALKPLWFEFGILN